MKINVADEFVDEIVAEELKQTIGRLTNQISIMYGKRNITNVQKQDLADFQEDIVAARRMYRYFSGKVL